MIDSSRKDVRDVIIAIVASYDPSPGVASLDQAVHLLDGANLKVSKEVK